MTLQAKPLILYAICDSFFGSFSGRIQLGIDLNEAANRLFRIMRAQFFAFSLWAAMVLQVSGAYAENAHFSFSIMGIGAGYFQFDTVYDARNYTIMAELKSTGLVNLLRPFLYEAVARGRFSGNVFQPKSYEERARSGKKRYETWMSYRAGVPLPREIVPPEPKDKYALDPATQKGAVDPVTALYAILRDVAPKQACKASVYVFDGSTRARISLDQRHTVGDQIRCQGEYRRIAGYSLKQMAEKQAFPFVLTYGHVENGQLQVVEVTIDTIYGVAKLQRR